MGLRGLTPHRIALLAEDEKVIQTSRELILAEVEKDEDARKAAQIELADRLVGLGVLRKDVSLDLLSSVNGVVHDNSVRSVEA